MAFNCIWSIQQSLLGFITFNSITFVDKARLYEEECVQVSSIPHCLSEWALWIIEFKKHCLWWISVFFGYSSFNISFNLRSELVSVGVNTVASQLFLFNDHVTTHALIMIFLFVMPLTFGAIGNYVLPIQWRVVDLVLPRLNNLSFTIYTLASLMLILSSCQEVGVGLGWTCYPPLSNNRYAISLATDYACFSLHLLGLSSIFASLNFITTTFATDSFSTSRPSIDALSWSIIITGFLLLTCLPVLAIALTFLLIDRNLNTCFLDTIGGGDLLLFQHLFWYFGHPEVYIIILPVFGISTHTLCRMLNDQVFSNNSMIIAMACLSSLSFLVWVHHLMTTGMFLDSRLYFSGSTMLIAIPTAIKVNSWTISILGSHVQETLFWLLCCNKADRFQNS